MKTNLLAVRSLATSAAFAAAIFMASAASGAVDAGADLLNSVGAIQVVKVGRYVETGTMRIQVSAKLGKPDSVLPNGTWLYVNRSLEESAARGTLVVRFEGGRVSEMALVTPAVALAMRQNPQQPLRSYLVATK